MGAVSLQFREASSWPEIKDLSSDSEQMILYMGHFVTGHDRALIVFCDAAVLSAEKSIKDLCQYNLNFWYIFYGKNWWLQRKIRLESAIRDK